MIRPIIPLRDDKCLKWEELYPLAGRWGWKLYHADGAFIRYLDIFESGFVDGALKAGAAP